MRPTPKEIGASIDAHRAHPEVDLRAHSRNKQIELAMSLKGRRAIYLDLKFWIGIRDAQAVGHALHPYSTLLSSLRAASIKIHHANEFVLIDLFEALDPQGVLCDILVQSVS